MKRILITGAAGFIGFHLARHLKIRGDFVLGLDNFNSYYDVRLKKLREQVLLEQEIAILEADIRDTSFLKELVNKYQITHIVHLAAQAGVRYSFANPDDYVSSNLQGFASILETCRSSPAIKLIYASSSSVYGLNEKIPFSVEDRTDQPTNLYGATKKANEVMAHAYHHLYGLSTTALRYFTAYGPWGRPDMAYYRFTQHICEGKPIQIFNCGKMRRDFTYIDDIAAGTVKVLDKIASANSANSTHSPDPATSSAPYRVYNIGNHQPEDLMHFIETLEKELGVTANKNFMPMQAGDVLATYADVDDLKQDVGYAPSTSLQVGIKKWVQWYREHADGIYI